MGHRCVYRVVVAAVISLIFTTLAEVTQAQQNRCTALSEYQEFCQNIREDDRCSQRLYELCCSCQGVWGTSYSHCTFVLTRNEPPPTPAVTPVPTATPDPCPSGFCPRGCREIHVKFTREDLILGSVLLQELSLRSLKRLARNAKRVGERALSSRLSKSAKRVDKRLKLLFAQGTLQFANLPDIMLICPESVQCTSVDNTQAINIYKAAVRGIATAGLRALNRATRLVRPYKIAVRRTRGDGVLIRFRRSELVRRAEELPPVQSECRR